MLSELQIWLSGGTQICVTLFLTDQVCINHFNLSRRRLWVFFISPEWSSEQKFHNIRNSVFVSHESFKVTALNLVIFDANVCDKLEDDVFITTSKVHSFLNFINYLNYWYRMKYIFTCSKVFILLLKYLSSSTTGSHDDAWWDRFMFPSRT